MFEVLEKVYLGVKLVWLLLVSLSMIYVSCEWSLSSKKFFLSGCLSKKKSWTPSGAGYQCVTACYVIKQSCFPCEGP